MVGLAPQRPHNREWGALRAFLSPWTGIETFFGLRDAGGYRGNLGKRSMGCEPGS